MSLGLILSSAIMLVLAAAATATAEEIGYNDTKPIGIVSDSLREVHETFVKVIGQSRHVLSFSRFAHRYGKMYESAEEMKLRFSVYKENLGLIRSTNQKGLSYKLSLNKFADMTGQEFQRHNLGDAKKYTAALVGSRKLTESAVLVGSQKLTVSAAAIPLTTGEKMELSALSNSKELVALPRHSALEAAYHQAFGHRTDLSEQQLVDCAKDHGCSGGLPVQAFRYIKDNGGITNEASHPITGRVGNCWSHRYVAVKLLDYVNITKGAELELLRAVGLVRPVSVAIHVGRDFQFYRSGVFTSLTCLNTLKDANHYVLAVGYGNQIALPYWILKNSWGSDWGESGYVRISRGVNMCGKLRFSVYYGRGVANNAVYPVMA
ncbi:unnamed protein product [Thlaspi arvense]|uniref:Uncharacterized protein n=1 Tax=Thlaspi arvense TaxID=13288 RepID=A0AAU9SHH1_THLAR|nr:unnamed protein product [Thlaspi arvense]